MSRPDDPPGRTGARRARRLTRTVTASLALVSLGFLFHTSHDPVVFGKYNLRYSVFLVALFGLLLPLAHFAVGFLLATHELRRSGGRRLIVGPALKLKAMLVLGVVAYVVAQWAIGRLLATQVATHDAHQFHPYLQNVARPLHAGQHVNRWGFKGDEIELRKPPGTFRVFVFGGSTVHCGTVDYQQTHCRLLEQRLEAEYPDRRIELQNLGAEWHSTQHDLIKLLFDAQDFSPDLVVIFHGINDLVRGWESDFFADGPYRADYRHYYGAAVNLARPDRAAAMFSRMAAGHWCSDWRYQQVRLAGPEGRGLNGLRTLFFPRAETVDLDEWPSLPAFERNLRDFVSIAVAKRMQVLLATQPSLYRLDLSPRDQELLVFPAGHQFGGRQASLASMVDGMQRFNDVTRRLAREQNVRCVDLERQMPKTTEFLYDDVHYTPAGNRLIADALADEIVSWGVVPAALEHRDSPSPRSSPIIARQP